MWNVREASSTFSRKVGTLNYYTSLEPDFHNPCVLTNDVPGKCSTFSFTLFSIRDYLFMFTWDCVMADVGELQLGSENTTIRYDE